jgi:putative oxidoreductase
MKRSEIFYWLARLVASFIMLQTLYFKFTASEESVFIFTTAGMEPWGRIGVGVLELIASVFLLIPATVWAGAMLAFGLMAGAIAMHVTLLGIEVKGDGGQLFIYALIVVACAAFSFFKSRAQVPEFIRKWLPSILFK